MNTLPTELKKKYFEALNGLIEIEPYETDSALISLPLHISGYTRIEFGVRRIAEDQYVLSDNAQTIGELESAGYRLNSTVREKIHSIIKLWHVELSGDALWRTCTSDELGIVLHEFGEAAKTIGDAFLAYPSKPSPRTDTTEVRNELRKALEKDFQYKEGHSVPGRLERYKVDFYISPNGHNGHAHNGLALSIMSDMDRVHAEAWGFRTLDIQKIDERIKVGVVYDADSPRLGRALIGSVVDMPLPSNEVSTLRERVSALGIPTIHAGNGNGKARTPNELEIER